MQFNFSIYIWLLLILFFVISIILLLNIVKLQRKLTYVKKEHSDYVAKQLIDLRKICHNINTPSSSILTMLNVFEKKIYGDLSQPYADLVSQGLLAAEDLKNNITDIQNYCNFYTDYHNLSLSDLQKRTNLKLSNPYIIEVSK